MNHYTRYSFCLLALAGLLTATVMVARQFGNGEPLELLAPCVLALLSAGAGGGLFVSSPEAACAPTGGHGALDDLDLDGIDS